MGIFDRFKKKEEFIEKPKEEIIKVEDPKENYSLVEMNNYMLADVRKENIGKSGYSLSLAKLSEISPITIPTQINPISNFFLFTAS